MKINNFMIIATFHMRLYNKINKNIALESNQFEKKIYINQKKWYKIAFMDALINKLRKCSCKCEEKSIYCKNTI